MRLSDSVLETSLNQSSNRKCKLSVGARRFEKKICSLNGFPEVENNVAIRTQPQRSNPLK
jgi:hypothetical protein